AYLFFRHRYTVFFEKFLCLIFMNLQVTSSDISNPSPPLWERAKVRGNQFYHPHPEINLS
ncbi:MAG: hypothetical protein ABIL14_07185, partial [candidate division WOR-3 bacterium]